MNRQRILAIDFTSKDKAGPSMFHQALQALVTDSYEVHWFTENRVREGTMFCMPTFFIHPLYPLRTQKKMFNGWYYLLGQFLLFFKILWKAQRGDIIYIDSIFPVGASLAGRLKDAKVVYHIDDGTDGPGFLKRFLLWIAGQTATYSISQEHTASCMSDHFVRQILGIFRKLRFAHTYPITHAGL